MSDPVFYAYLCAVADWRLKKPNKLTQPRPGILTWDTFFKLYRAYYDNEPNWRKQLIQGNVDYYSRGVLRTGCLY